MLNELESQYVIEEEKYIFGPSANEPNGQYNIQRTVWNICSGSTSKEHIYWVLSEWAYNNWTDVI